LLVGASMSVLYIISHNPSLSFSAVFLWVRRSSQRRAVSPA
jgi:hypothetical protein